MGARGAGGARAAAALLLLAGGRARAAAWAGAGAGAGAPAPLGVADVGFWAAAPAAAVPVELLREAAGWENSWTAEWEDGAEWGDGEEGCECAYE